MIPKPDLEGITPSKQLTDKRRAFCEAYASGSNKRTAYMSAFACDGISETRVNQRAGQLLCDPAIRAEVDRLRDEASKRCEINVTTLTAMYIEERAFARECMSPSGSIAAVNKLGELYGLFPDKRHRVAIESAFAGMTKEELNEWVARKVSGLGL